LNRKLLAVAGTRPEIIKLAPILWELERRGLDYVWVWAGQHYDYNMSDVFLVQMDLPRPNYRLGISNASQIDQVTGIMLGLNQLLGKINPGLLIAVGDTNTVLATSLVASKRGIPFAHVEAGLRSFDRTMPEEINRTIADHLGTLLFAPSDRAKSNLLRENITKEIYITGNTVVDACVSMKQSANRFGRDFFRKTGITGKYILATIHRAGNTDDPMRLRRIMAAIEKITTETKVLFPVHPRTRKMMEQYGIKLASSNLIATDPLGYFEFLYSLENSQVVLTDSGGVQEEAFTLGVPCVTARDNTERPETVELGGNILVGTKVESIVTGVKWSLRHSLRIKERIKSASNPYGTGSAGKNIVKIIMSNWSL
jgi:UDP-N-acetylglucosamine 2-epimerase (non-hydrolysing)